MHKYLHSIVSGLVLGAAYLTPAVALPSTTAMREEGYTLAPFSFAKFCIDYPSDCSASGGPSRVALTAERMAELSEINRSVNTAIIPTPDRSKLHYWHLNITAGDCNSYAIQKRHELMTRGWPAAALALTVVKTAWGEGHLVVTVRTDQGDLVLDNLRSKVVSWAETGYQFIMRQSEQNPQFWVELDGGHVGREFAAKRLDRKDQLAAATVRNGTDGARSTSPTVPSTTRPDQRRFVANSYVPPTAGETAKPTLADRPAIGPTVAPVAESNGFVLHGRQTISMSSDVDGSTDEFTRWLRDVDFGGTTLEPQVRRFTDDIVALANLEVKVIATAAATIMAVRERQLEPMEYGIM